MIKERFAVLFLLSGLCFGDGGAQSKTCSETEARAAMDASYGLKNWTEIYKSFKRFGHCDDGHIAEGYSDSIVRTLASRWNQTRRLNKLASSDSKFHAFVLRHIDATTDDRDLKKVMADAKEHCPSKAETLCREIEKHARDALRESR